MAIDPREVVVRNLFAIQRAGTTLNDQASRRISDLFGEIAGLLVRIDPTGPSLQRYRLQRAEKLFGEIASLTGETFDAIHKEIRVRLAQVGQQQADTSALHLKAVLGAGKAGDVEVVRVTLNQMKAIVDARPVQGHLLKDWFKSQSERTVFQVQRQIQLGMTNAETVDQMVRRVRGRAVGRGRYVGGVMQTTTREAEAIVRTAVTEIANAAALTTFEQNRDVAPEYEYVATLDSRTTLVCASLDGRRYRYDDAKAKRPPQHVGCRSIVVPVVDWKGLGLEPPPEGERASASGPVPADTKYEDWLRAQPEGVQNEILGAGRAALFRDGKLGLRDLVKTDGRRVSLAELVDRKGAPSPPAPKRLPSVIESTADLERVMKSRDDLYVRWSRGEKFDREQKFSRDYQAGTAHDGLSARQLTPDMTLPEALNRVKEYGFLRLKDEEIRPWIYAAERVGTDSDSAATIRIKSLVAGFSDGFVALLDQQLPAAISLVEEISDAEARLAKITNAFAREITEERIQKSRAALEKLLDKSEELRKVLGTSGDAGSA